MLLLVIHKAAFNTIVTGLCEKDGDTYDETKFIECTKEVYDYISKLNSQADLGLGYVTLTDKCSCVTSVKQLSVNPIYFSDIEELETIKKSFILKARKVLDSRLINDELLLDFYDYLLCRDTLHWKGYNIFSENESDLTCKILESNDEELISCLNRFLDAKKTLDMKHTWYKIFTKFRADIQLLDDKQAIEKLYNDYLEKFF